MAVPPSVALTPFDTAHILYIEDRTIHTCKEKDMGSIVSEAGGLRSK